MAAMLTFDSSLKSKDIGPQTLYKETPERLTTEEDTFEMALPAGAPTCCGVNLYLYVRPAWNVFGRRVRYSISDVNSRKTKILCSDPCASSPGG